MRIVLDAMGSDNAPDPEVRGAVEASRESEAEFVLVGDKALLEAKLKSFPKRGKITLVQASERVLMTDSPMLAIRQKKDSSLLVGLRIVKEGNAAGFLSAGNTGAVMLGARVVLGPIRGVARSAICQVLPTKTNPVVVLDLGANVDCTAEHLCQFAEMGQVYSQLNFGIDKPRVGLLNIGEEKGKGNETAKKVHERLTAAPHINFIGNIEPKALYAGQADVVVCDGFIGNLLLKTSEAVAGLVKTLLEREMKASVWSMIGAALSLPALRRIKRRTDPNLQNGAPLLGVNGIVIIAHGSCTHEGIKNALLGIEAEAELGLNEHIQQGIANLRAEESAARPAGIQT
jgi:glycerol-3-phosphate acyltransferase PlsX